MLVGLCSVKGSPGVTTAALAMAARWPDGEPIVVEADPAGGDLTARFRLSATPGVVSLAAAARRQSSAELLEQHCQRLPGGLRVVVGPVAPEQAQAALEVLTARGFRTLQAAAQSPEYTMLVDVGRVDPASPALPLVRGADALVIMTRPQADELSHVAAMTESISTWTRTPGLVLIGDGYPRIEVERELGVPVMATLPNDPQGASILCGQPRGRDPDRSALGHAAAGLGRTLLSHIQPTLTGTDSVFPAATSATDNGETWT